MLCRVLLLLLGGCLVSCTSETKPNSNGPSSPGELVASSKPRDAAPDTRPEDLAKLTGDNAAFGWDFYHQVVKDRKNLFFSPHSISVALAMTWAGSRNNTEAQMAEALHFTLGQGRLHPAFNALDRELGARGDQGGPEAAMPFRLHVTNALFGQVGFMFLDPFLDTLAQSYGAGVRVMDFSNEPEESRLVINNWVSDQTEERIEDLIAPGIITDLTRLVLVNAIYFSASWAKPFDEANTKDDPFTLLDGTQISTPTMRAGVTTGYADGANYQAVELAYDGGQLLMLLIVPHRGELAAVESMLSADDVARIRSELREHLVDLALPKFSFRSLVPAKAPLQALGMVEAFSSKDADLSGMNGQGNLHIQDVVHQGFVAVDEKGTEAAAATAVIVGTTSIPPQATLHVDRPFVFAIIDRPTGATLFLGRVVDPSK